VSCPVSAVVPPKMVSRDEVPAGQSMRHRIFMYSSYFQPLDQVRGSPESSVDELRQIASASHFVPLLTGHDTPRATSVKTSQTRCGYMAESDMDWRTLNLAGRRTGAWNCSTPRQGTRVEPPFRHDWTGIKS
jgi:hypothetical protein